MGAPCNGELQFWSVMQSQMREQSKQLARIASALEAGRAREERPPAVDCAKLREVLDDALGMINAWRAGGNMEHWQYDPLFDRLDAALAAIPEEGAGPNKDNKDNKED